MIKLFTHKEVVEMWNAGYSAPDIIDLLDLSISIRQVQRIGAAEGSWKKRWLGRMERHEAAEHKPKDIVTK